MHHPFTKQAIGLVKLGQPKPLWYEAIVEECPPLRYHSSKSRTFKNLNKMAVKPSHHTPKTSGMVENGYWNDRTGTQGMTLKMDGKTKVEKPPPIERIVPGRIVFPEDRIRKELNVQYPLEKFQAKTLQESPHKSESFVDIEYMVNLKQSLIESGKGEREAHEEALEKYTQKKRELELREKLAREQTTHYHNPSVGKPNADEKYQENTIDPELMKYDEWERQVLDDIKALKQKQREEREKYRREKLLTTIPSS